MQNSKWVHWYWLFLLPMCCNEENKERNMAVTKNKDLINLTPHYTEIQMKSMKKRQMRRVTNTAGVLILYCYITIKWCYPALCWTVWLHFIQSWYIVIMTFNPILEIYFVWFRQFFFTFIVLSLYCFSFILVCITLFSIHNWIILWLSTVFNLLSSLSMCCWSSQWLKLSCDLGPLVAFRPWWGHFWVQTSLLLV